MIHFLVELFFEIHSRKNVTSKAKSKFFLHTFKKNSIFVFAIGYADYLYNAVYLIVVKLLYNIYRHINIK